MIVVQRSRPIYDLGGRTRLFGSVSGNSRTSLSSRAESELPAPSRECGFPIGEKRGGGAQTDPAQAHWLRVAHEQAAQVECCWGAWLS